MTIIPPRLPSSSIRGIRSGLCFPPIVNFGFGATAGYGDSRYRRSDPAANPCCHRLQSAESGHPLDENRVDCDRLLMHEAGLTVKFQSSWMDRHD